MAFNRFTKNVLNISALPDRVQNQAQALKATFDQAGVDIKGGLNGLIDELESDTSAKNLGAKTQTGEKSTVQELFDGLFTSISGKVEKVEGKQLSTEDFTTEEKAKLNNIADGANNYVLPVASTSELGGIKVDGSTIVVENGVARAKAADAADYVARSEIEKLKTNKAETKEYNAIIPTEGWTETAPYTIEIAVLGMLVTDKNFPVSPIYTAEEYAAQTEAWNKISFIDAGTDKITVTCMDEKPTTAIPIQITVVR